MQWAELVRFQRKMWRVSRAYCSRQCTSRVAESIRTLTRQMQSSPWRLQCPGGEGTEYLTVTRIYSDESGESRFGSFRIQMKGSGDIGYLSKELGCSSLIARYTPRDYNYSWHNAPRRQFIVNLDADVEVEVGGGEKKVIRRGEVFFVEDITGKGHFSKAVDGKPRYSLFFPVPDDFTAEDC